MTVSHPTELACREVVALVTELLSDAMPPEDRARIEQHLLVCPPCTMHVAQVRATIALTAGLRAPAVAADPAAKRDANGDANGAVIDLFRTWKKVREP